MDGHDEHKEIAETRAAKAAVQERADELTKVREETAAGLIYHAMTNPNLGGLQFAVFLFDPHTGTFSLSHQLSQPACLTLVRELARINGAELIEFPRRG